MAIDGIKHASHAGQILVIFLCLLVYWRFWDIISKGGCGGEPHAVLGGQVPRSCDLSYDLYQIVFTS